MLVIRKENKLIVLFFFSELWSRKQLCMSAPSDHCCVMCAWNLTTHLHSGEEHYANDVIRLRQLAIDVKGTSHEHSAGDLH